jgi:hypothetical protein
MLESLWDWIFAVTFEAFRRRTELLESVHYDGRQ